jgi:NAD(P)-dependent dehydrogenase (short-subunit alcohol dehydrogenase family)
VSQCGVGGPNLKRKAGHGSDRTDAATSRTAGAGHRRRRRDRRGDHPRVHRSRRQSADLRCRCPALARFAEAHPETAATVADVSDQAAVERLFVEVAARLGGLDVLINNAGIAGPTGPIDKLAVSDIKRTLDIDLMGQFLVARLAAPLLRASSDPSIINMSSVAGRLGYGMRTPYSAAKWGVVGFTASLAKELGQDGIRVNAILPGIVRGPRMERVIRERAESADVSYQEMEIQFVKQISHAPHDRTGRRRRHGVVPIFACRSQHLGSGNQRVRQRRKYMSNK